MERPRPLMPPVRRGLVVALAAGLLIRLWALALPGTGDVVIWKVWSYAGATDLTAMYGVGGAPPERRVLHWRGEAMTVDYPPIALAELAVAGRLYRIWSPTFDDSRVLNAAVKLPGLAAELLLLAWILRRGPALVGDRASAWLAAAFWLSPAILLDGTVLGYLDMQMAVPLLFAVIAAWRGRPGAAGALLAVAVLTKAQAIFVAPLVLVAALRQAGPMLPGLARFAGGGGLVTVAALVPFLVRGAWNNLVQALASLAAHDMLSAQAANVWWIVTWVLRVVDVGPEWGWPRAIGQEVRILAISRATALGYPNARLVGLAIVTVLLVWGLVGVWRRPSPARIAATAAWSMYAYALFAAQVHENHLVPAVVLLAPAAAMDARLRPVFRATAAVVALNLYLFYGLGDGWPGLPRQITYVDASVLLAFASLGVFAWFTRLLARAPR